MTSVNKPVESTSKSWFRLCFSICYHAFIGIFLAFLIWYFEAPWIFYAVSLLLMLVSFVVFSLILVGSRDEDSNDGDVK